MTNGFDTEAAPHRADTRKSIKEQIRWQIWVIVAANSLLLYSVAQANAINSDSLHAAVTNAHNIVPVGFAIVISTVLNGLVGAEIKARLVFLRWHHSLPGHRAFSKYAINDSRIDPSALEKVHGGPLPTDPVEQNRTWYRIYKAVESDPAVRQIHRDFLLMRDYTGLCMVFIVFYGAAAIYAISSTQVGLIYLLVLVAQYAVVRQAASNYGARMVTTVLARSASRKDGAATTPRKRGRSKTTADTSDTRESSN